MKRFASAVLCLFLIGCNQGQLDNLSEENTKLKNENQSLKTSIEKQELKLKRAEVLDQRLGFLVNQMKGVKARIKTNMGDIEVKFHPENAPIHCFNFITRAESGFYNGTKFHRVIPGFMIQGGDPNSKDNNPADDGGGGPLVHIPHEFNNTSHVPGILSMARVSDVSAGAGSQFFIIHGNAEFLNQQYTAFGEVTKGQDVVDKIAKAEINPRIKDRPAKDMVIKQIEVFR
jgi:peptidyl-prolyl cis-trans isomerase B (cyclophilin B)